MGDVLSEEQAAEQNNLSSLHKAVRGRGVVTILLRSSMLKALRAGTETALIPVHQACNEAGLGGSFCSSPFGVRKAVGIGDDFCISNLLGS